MARHGGDGDLDRLHAAAGDVKALRREGAAELARVVGGKGRAQLRYAALPSVERLAGLHGPRGRVADEAGGGEVALADPERDEALPPAAVIEHLEDARFRDFTRLAPEREQEVLTHR